MSTAVASPAPAPAATAPTQAPYAAVPQAPPNVPVQATMLPDTPFAVVPSSTASDDRMQAARAAAVASARNIDKAAIAQSLAPAAPAAPTVAEAATKPAEVTAEKPAEPVKPVVEAEKPKEPRADTVTARIADLTKRNREVAARAAAAEARAVAAEAAATESAAAAKALREAPDKFEAIKAAFRADPLAALDQIGEKWADIVTRVASGGIPPTPEQIAAAEAQRAQAERDARIAALEAEQKAAKEASKAREEAARETERTRVEAEQLAGARDFVATKLITAESHPFLVGIASDAAEEALAQVDAALAQAHKAGQRKTPFPTSMEESLKLTRLALDGVNAYYQDLAQRIAPNSKSPQQAGESTSVAVVPAATAASAVVPVVAESQQRRPVGTITHAVAGEMPQATQPQRLTPEEARIRAMDAARRLPALRETR